MRWRLVGPAATLTWLRAWRGWAPWVIGAAALGLILRLDGVSRAAILTTCAAMAVIITAYVEEFAEGRPPFPRGLRWRNVALKTFAVWLLFGLGTGCALVIVDAVQHAH